MPESQSGSTPSAQQEVMVISPSPSALPQARTAAYDHGQRTVSPTVGGDGAMDGMDGMTGMDGMADMPGMEHSHAPATEASASRPRGLVLGGFGAVNGLALAVAAILRRSGRGERERRRDRRAVAMS
ncbi:MAG TPA: hypothetical protein VFP72_02950 [Kineosporiaceae bacterium]|nr:hypothetical protein [Kineosporiaceae bacterium]